MITDIQKRVIEMWIFGVAKMVSQKQNYELGSVWEMPAYVIIHVLALCGLLDFDF